MRDLHFYAKSVFFVLIVIAAIPFLFIESILIGLVIGIKDFSGAVKSSYIDMWMKHYATKD